MPTMTLCLFNSDDISDDVALHAELTRDFPAVTITKMEPSFEGSWEVTFKGTPEALRAVAVAVGEE